jgi:hypothetical protein
VSAVRCNCSMRMDDCCYCCCCRTKASRRCLWSARQRRQRLRVRQQLANGSGGISRRTTLFLRSPRASLTSASRYKPHPLHVPCLTDHLCKRNKELRTSYNCYYHAPGQCYKPYRNGSSLSSSRSACYNDSLSLSSNKNDMSSTAMLAASRG